jgi:hypothetical protein
VVSRKAASIGAQIVSKGNARPSAPEDNSGANPEVKEKIIPITVRLKESMYRALTEYGLRKAPREPNQHIMVQALEEFLQ